MTEIVAEQSPRESLGSLLETEARPDAQQHTSGDYPCQVYKGSL